MLIYFAQIMININKSINITTVFRVYLDLDVEHFVRTISNLFRFTVDLSMIIRY